MADFDPRSPAQDNPPIGRETKAPKSDIRGSSNPDAPSGAQVIRLKPLLTRTAP